MLANPEPTVAKSLAAFVLRVLMWGTLLFAAWYFGSRPLSVVTAYIAARTAEHAGPVERVKPRFEKRDVVFEVHPASATVLRDRLPVGLVVEAPVNPLKHSFGLPFFLALLLASRPAGLAWKALAGAAAILVVAGVGMACDLLVQIRQAATPQGALLFPFGATAREAIAVGYQLGVLILPTVLPVVLWAAMDRGMALRLKASATPAS